jgi:hypothetical protein
MAVHKRNILQTALILGLAIFVGLSIYLNTSHDDAFISFRYVKNFVEGHGLVYNVGERVEGYTNFLWILLLSLFVKVGFDIVLVSKVLGILSGAMTIYLVYRFSVHLPGERGFYDLIAVYLLAVNLSFVYWDSSGLETNFFALLLTWGVLQKVREMDDEKAFPVSSLILAMASMARPEGILVFGLVIVFDTLSTLMEERTMRIDMRAVGLFLIIFLPYYIWRYAYYGYPLPNTFYAKTGGGLGQVRRGLVYAMSFFLLYNVLPLLPGGLLLLRRVRSRGHLLILFVVTIYTLYIIAVGGDHMILYRFFVPIIPLICLLTQEGLRTIPRLTGMSHRPTLAVVLGIIILTILPYGSQHRSKIEAMRKEIRTWIETGKWFHAHAYPGETLALGAAGAIPYYSGLRAIDFYGLIDTHIAHTASPHSGHGMAGHEKGDVGYLLSRHPDYIIPYPMLRSDEARTAQDLRNCFRHGTEIDIWKDPEFQQNYEVANARIREGFVGFFRRRE